MDPISLLMDGSWPGFLKSGSGSAKNPDPEHWIFYLNRISYIPWHKLCQARQYRYRYRTVCTMHIMQYCYVEVGGQYKTKFTKLHVKFSRSEFCAKCLKMLYQYGTKL